MSQIVHFSTQLKTMNLDLMKKAIEVTKNILGGEGLLSGNIVEGYDTQEIADMVFIVKGMKFPMGIKQTKNGVVFVGDPWGSEKWNTVQESVLDSYTAVNGAIALQQMGFAVESETNDNPVGILVKGMRA